MTEYAKRKEALGQYEGKEIENTDNVPIPEKIDFDASGFVTLHYNYEDNEDKIKCREVRLYYSYDGSGLSALLGLAKGKVKSMDSPSEKDKPKKLSNAAVCSIDLQPYQMNNVIRKINRFNNSKYRLFSNNRIDFLKAIAQEVGLGFNYSDPIYRRLCMLQQEYEKSNIRNGLFRYRKGDMSRTNSHMTAFDAIDRLNRLTEKQDTANQWITSQLFEVKETSQEYVSAVDKAREYLKNVGDSEEELQNKVLVKSALDKCISACSGSMQDKVSDESVLDDSSIEIKIGNENVDSLLSQDMLDVRDWPLFPWRPCVSDIKQGYLGDCWLEAALASLVNKDPKYIEGSLRDNHDGTVTGRIYDKDEDNKRVKPRYYRVTKSIPHLSGTNSTISPAFSKNACLWPEMIRKILIKYIADKGGKTVINGDMVTNPTYRWLHGGTVANPLTEIFQFFSRDYVETEMDTMSGLSLVKSGFSIRFDGKGVFNSNQKEVVAKSLIKYLTDPTTNKSPIDLIFQYDSNDLDKLKNNIEPLCSRKRITSDEDLCKIIQSNSRIIERMFSDQNIMLLLRIKEIREGVSSDITEFLKQIIRKNVYYNLQYTFRNSGGMMSASAHSFDESSYIEQLYEQYSDILGKITKPNSADGIYEKEMAGLYTDHAYTVLGLEEEDGNYFVKIRNPWGRSQRYDYVTPDGKLESKYNVNGDEGRVEILEFLRFFNQIEYVSRRRMFF